PPVVLVLLVCAGFYLLFGMDKRRLVLAVVALASSIAYLVYPVPESLARVVDKHAGGGLNVWSPYYHVQTFEIAHEGRPLGTAVVGNHNPLQFIFNLHMSQDD